MPSLPVTLRNLEPEVQGQQWSALDDAKPIPGSVLRIGAANARTVVDWMRRVRDAGERRVRAARGGGRPAAAQLRGGRVAVRRADRTRAIRVPKPLGARAFEVVGIPLKQPGFYVVELASPKLGAALLAGANPEPEGKPRSITSPPRRW